METIVLPLAEMTNISCTVEEEGGGERRKGRGEGWREKRAQGDRERGGRQEGGGREREEKGGG